MRKKLITILFLTLMPLLSNAETKELKSGDTFTATVNGTTFNMKVINPLFKTCVVGSGKRGDAFVSGGKNWDGTFPSKVTDSDGLVFTVIGVNNRAFIENDGINTITLPANTNVDLYEGAFMRCHNLTTIIIPEGVTILGLGQYVFNGCFDRDFFREATLELPSTLRTINKGDYDSPFRNMALRKVIAKMEEPFSISTLFSDDHYANATLYVPYGKADVYKNTEGWKKFSNIVELIPGDVNGEGNVDEEDTKSMSEIIVKQKDQTAATPNADLNGDHKVNVVDMVKLVNLIIDLEEEGEDATSPSGVTAAIKSIIQSAKPGEPVNIILKETITTKSGDTEIVIPTKNSAGEAIDVNLVFKRVPSETGGSLVIKTDQAGNPSSTAINKISVIVPESSIGTNLTIDAPTSTVTLLSANGAKSTYKEVVARTANNTLIVEDDVLVNNVEVQGGTVQVNEGGILESWSFSAEKNGDLVNVKEDGGIEPIKVNTGTDNDDNPIEQWQIASEDGNPYYANSLKIVKGAADYAIVWFGNPSYEAIPLKTVAIGDGAVLQTNYIAMENIEGEGTASIKYRFTGPPTGYTDDTEYGGNKFYEYNSDMVGVKRVKGITFSQPEIATDEYFKQELNEKEAEGYRMNEPRLNLDVDTEIEGCTFNYNHVFICQENSLSCPLVKDCKFVHVDHDLNVIPINNDQVEFRIPYNPSKDSNGITFDGCEFSAGTKFMGYFYDRIVKMEFEGDDIQYTGYVNFKNCKLGGADFTGENTDFVKNFWAVTGTKIIISFDDVPKYEALFDSEGGGFVVRPIGESEEN